MFQFYDIINLDNNKEYVMDNNYEKNINENNGIIEIPEDNIYMEFSIDNQDYVVFTEDDRDTEEMSVMFAKCDVIDGKRILRNIENNEEYEMAVNEFNRRINEIDFGE